MKEIFMSAESVTPARLRRFMEGALVHDKSVIDDELVNERHALMLMQNPQVVKTMVVPNMTARLSEIKCPSLGFWGINEKMMPETGILKLAKGMPNLRMVTVQNCGHWVIDRKSVV